MSDNDNGLAAKVRGLDDRVSALEAAFAPTAPGYLRLKEQAAEDPSTLVDILQNSIQSLDADYRQRLADEKAAMQAETKAELDAIKAEWAASKLSSDPVYREHQDEVQAAMQEFGVNQETAIKFVGKMLESTGQIVDTPLGTTGTHVSTSNGQKPAKMSADSRARLEEIHGPLSDEEVTALAG